MIRLTSYEQTFAALPDGIREAEVNAERRNVTKLYVSNGAIQGSEVFVQTKYYVRASGERTGVIYTENPDEDAADVLRRAMVNADFTTVPEPEPMNRGAAPQHLDDTPLPAVAELLDAACRLEKLLAGADVLELSVTCTERELRTLNSHGYDANSRTVHIQLYTMVSLPREGMQSSVIETSVSAQRVEDLDVPAFAAKALRLADAYDGGGLAPVTIPSGQYDAVLSGQVMRNILMTAWRAFSAEAMQRGGSCFRTKGEQAGSAAFTLINSPTHPASGECWPIDSEGTSMKETLVVDRGVIHEPLYTLASAKADGTVSNGCTGRVPCMTGNVPISLTTVPGMIYVKPGQQSEDALLAQLTNGLYLTYSLDLFHSVNIASGEFSVPCGGVYYENGQPVGSVSQITVAGRLPELFSAIEAVADDLDFDDFYFHNYAVGSPTVLAKGLTFAS